VTYEVEFPEGFISLDELLQRVLVPEDEARLPEARRAFSEARVARTGKAGLADLRLQRGLTQKQLADLAFVTQPRLSLWESRKEKPTVDHVRALAKALTTDCNTIICAIFDE
jgi:DNA-binding transcriptional regulator YiaG